MFNKERIINVLLVLCVVCAVAACVCKVVALVEQPKEQTYAMTCKVVATDREYDTLVLKDSTGNLWALEGCEDWQVNDCCAVVMNDKGTDSIYDDEIVSLRYQAWNLQ